MIKDNENIGVTLIDPKDKFVFSPLYLELAFGSANVAGGSSLLRGSSRIKGGLYAPK
jgi:NADH dehydrogenase FAD-containing subunit